MSALLGHQIWAKPVSPHPWDEEFDGSVLGSEWYAYVNSSMGNIEYNTVDIYDTTHTSGTTVRLNMSPLTRKSWGIIQPPNTWVMLGRALTLPTNLLVVTRLRFTQSIGSANNYDGQCGLSLLSDTGGNPDTNNNVRLYLNLNYSNVIAAHKSSIIGGSYGNGSDSSNTGAEGQALEYAAIHKLGTTYHFWVGTASGNWIWMGSITTGLTFEHVVIVAYASQNNNPGVSTIGVDFIRFYETDNFLF